jgi:hypothetical protein
MITPRLYGLLGLNHCPPQLAHTHTHSVTHHPHPPIHHQPRTCATLLAPLSSSPCNFQLSTHLEVAGGGRKWRKSRTATASGSDRGERTATASGSDRGARTAIINAKAAIGCSSKQRVAQPTSRTSAEPENRAGELTRSAAARRRRGHDDGATIVATTSTSRFSSLRDRVEKANGMTVIQSIGLSSHLHSASSP